jgi:uncharacterized membrane protein
VRECLASGVLAVLRMVGIFNAAVWLGSAVFFTFGVAPATFAPEMKRIFGDYYTGVIGQQLIGRYFTLNWICALIALAHFLGEMIYAGKSFHRFTFGLLLLVLCFGLLGQHLFAPRIKELQQLKYRGPVEQREPAAQQLKRLHATTMIGNLFCLVALVIYTWRVTHPPDHVRFASAQKFRG